MRRGDDHDMMGSMMPLPAAPKAKRKKVTTKKKMVGKKKKMGGMGMGY